MMGKTRRKTKNAGLPGSFQVTLCIDLLFSQQLLLASWSGPEVDDVWLLSAPGMTVAFEVPHSLFPV
jgi:hypothetical protein